MTTNVPKGANRGAAMAKKNKHAQRTPLPPRAGVVEEAKAVLQEVLLPSVAKATEFAAAAKGYGWVAESWWDGDHSKVLVTRGPESIQIEWRKGVFIPETCNYRYGTHNAVRLRNASAAKQRMAVPGDKVAPPAPAKGRQPGRSVGAPKRGPTRNNVNLEVLLDDDVLSAVRGRKIAWTNRVTEMEETDFVRDVSTVRVKGGQEGSVKVPVVSLAAPRIDEGPAGRVLHFLGAFGFRCVLVGQINRVGK